jgi:hypothetical protein
MKRVVLVVAAVFFLSWSGFAQTSSDDSPPSKADVERYLQVMHSQDITKKMMATVAQSMRQLMHERYLKHRDELPADYEAKMNARVADMFNNAPMDEMVQAMVPVYQKHFTKGDIDSLIAFYSSPTGEKVLREVPSMIAEAMQDMMPVMTKYTETVQKRLEKETDDMISQSKKQSNSSAPATNN